MEGEGVLGEGFCGVTGRVCGLKGREKGQAWRFGASIYTRQLSK